MKIVVSKMISFKNSITKKVINTHNTIKIYNLTAKINYVLDDTNLKILNRIYKYYNRNVI